MSPTKAGRRETAAVFAFALVARLAWVAWAGASFPVAADGQYYDKLAQRLAHGQGYTWAWPDGVVTFAAHYPVGYPAILAAMYAVFGVSPWVAPLVNGVLGALATAAAHRLLLASSGRFAAYVGAIAIAVHPALVPYTSAVMTEGITSALLVVSAAIAGRARTAKRAWGWLAAAGVALGVATLVRPQCLILAPCLGALALTAGAAWRARALGALLLLGMTIAVCLPWTARNCARMNRCALVSVNGGWNLLIGVQTNDGAWAEVDVPEPCRTVWDEAGKDSCFEAAGKRAIANDPATWAAKMPRKLAATFDYFGAAPWYLHSSNGAVVREVDKLAMGAVETIVARLLLIGALLSMARLEGPRSLFRALLCAFGVALAFTVHAWPAYLLLPLQVALLGPRRIATLPILVPWTAVVVALTAVAHAVFFGAGRYGLVVVPLVTALAFVRGSATRQA